MAMQKAREREEGESAQLRSQQKTPPPRSCQVLIFVGVGMSLLQIDGDEEGKDRNKRTAAPRALVPASPGPVVSLLI